MRDWHQHFCEILEGREEKEEGKKKYRNIGEDDEEKLVDEEIEPQIQNLKRRDQEAQIEF